MALNMKNEVRLGDATFLYKRRERFSGSPECLLDAWKVCYMRSLFSRNSPSDGELDRRLDCLDCVRAQ